MKILFVCHRLPYPPNRGGKIRPFNMIRHLGRKHSVVVASLAYDESEAKHGAELKEYCDDVICEVLPPTVRWTRAALSLFTSEPSSVAYFWSRRLYRRVRDRLATSKFDLILVHCAFMAQYVYDWNAAYRILDYGDLDSAKWAEYSTLKPFPLSLGYALEAKKLRRYERKLADRFNRCTVTTSGEKNEFDGLGVSTSCAVIPNGVDTTYFSPDGTGCAAVPTVAFLGRMDYFPNVDGVCRFVEEVFPIIRARVPNVEFRIVGSAPLRKIQDLAKIPGVFVTGHVPDIRNHLRDVAVSIAPLKIARGTQNKILESMAMGIPVVATPEAAKGVSAVPGRDLIVAEDNEAFASHVVTLLRNLDLRRDLSLAARRQVEDAHLWSNSMAMLDSLVNEVGCC
jgi:sugar transferase (PEP-CTERM/EpsH1 system associated)